MHIRKIELTNISCFPSLVWELEGEELAGWHVVIGDNASGKTSFLRATAYALLGPTDVHGLRFSPAKLLGVQEEHAAAWVDISVSEDDDRFPKAWEAVDFSSQLSLGMELRANNDGKRLHFLPVENRDIDLNDVRRANYVWDSREGWFSTSFGPMRRFSGGDRNYDHLFGAQPRLAAHLTLFGEDVALTEVSRWLEVLRFEQLEQGGEHGFLQSLIHFINQEGLLPHGAKLMEITSKGVFFLDGRGVRIELADLSDGFRSILSLAMELIRQLSANFGDDIFEACDDRIVVRPSGVVLIDEVDAHLHPTWQQRVGFWFTRHFPNIQFIVTTHSPLVCQAAINGSIFRLASPEEDPESSRFMQGEERKRLILGNVLDAYSTDAFGHITVPESTKELRKELALINAKKVRTEQEEARRGEIRDLLPSTMTMEQDESLDDLLGSMGLLDHELTTQASEELDGELAEEE